MTIHPNVVAAIGNTPLIKLERASEATGCTILGKAEFMNPGQSVKDRAALYLVRDAMAKGLVRSGGTIVEGTAGNTGIGLAMVGRALGLDLGLASAKTQAHLLSPITLRFLQGFCDSSHRTVSNIPQNTG